MHIFKVSLPVAVLASCALGFYATSAFAILNGHEVSPDSTVSQVTVLLTAGEDSKASECTGTRISADLILTAAHCAEDSNYVVFWNQSGSKILNKWTHPKWDADSDEYDAALLQIAGPYPVGPWAELPAEGEVIHPGQDLTVAGYGYTEVGEDSLLHATSYRAYRSYMKTQISYRGDNTGICGGDSGGGNFVFSGQGLTIVGVSSSTRDEDQYGCDDYGYLIRVSSLRKWIAGVRAPVKISRPIDNVACMARLTR